MVFLLFRSTFTCPLGEEPVVFNSFEGYLVVKADWPRHNVVRHLYGVIVEWQGTPVTVLVMFRGSGFVTSINPAQRCPPPGPWACWNMPQFASSVSHPLPSCCWTPWQWAVACCASVLTTLPGCRQGVSTVLKLVFTAVQSVRRRLLGSTCSPCLAEEERAQHSECKASHCICLVMVSHAQQSSCML